MEDMRFGKKLCLAGRMVLKATFLTNSIE